MILEVVPQNPVICNDPNGMVIGAMKIPPILHIWTMHTERLDEAAAASWLPMLDKTERKRAARFVFPRSRMEFIAAHALLRVALGWLYGTAPTSWQFIAEPLGKPTAWLQDEPASVAFNLSRTDGMVGVVACLGAEWAVGFDLELAVRDVGFAIADCYFSPQEVAWLESFTGTQRMEASLRLWTLKEAFIKTTGKGLSVDLAAFSFTVFPPSITLPTGSPEYDGDWWFEQRLLDGNFLAAVGIRCPASLPVETRWRVVEPVDFLLTGLRD
jgi:4'-phosphopantetheinyl transferase